MVNSSPYASLSGDTQRAYNFAPTNIASNPVLHELIQHLPCRLCRPASSTAMTGTCVKSCCCAKAIESFFFLPSFAFASAHANFAVFAAKLVIAIHNPTSPVPHPSPSLPIPSPLHHPSIAPPPPPPQRGPQLICSPAGSAATNLPAIGGHHHLCHR